MFASKQDNLLYFTTQSKQVINMATEVGKSGPTSGSIGGQVEGDHTSISTGGGAPSTSGTKDKGSYKRQETTRGTPTKSTNSGDL